MNKKPFNEIEEQMKAASEGWEPAFDEQSWQHMEKLLDREDDRRRPIAWWIWLLPILLLGIITGYFLLKDSDSKKAIGNSQHTASTNTDNVTLTENQPGKNIHPPLSQQSAATPTNFVSGQNNERPLLTNEKTEDSERTPSNVNSGSRFRANISSPLIEAETMQSIAKRDRKKQQDAARAAMKVVSADATSEELNNQSEKDIPVSTNITQPSPSPTVQAAEKINSHNRATARQKTYSVKKIVEPGSKTAVVKEKPARQLSRFSFALSGGVDGNGVDFPGLDKFASRAGLTIGYHFNDNWSVATGFFAGNKKYVAGKEDYKAKAGSYWAMVDIKEVDANCRVFEIPLWLRYDFVSGKKLKPFAAVGLSSFIMDKEDYEYYYYRMGNPYWSSHAYRGNQHLFSVLRIAGGLEKKIAPNFFLSVQPGLAIPLGGVGEGQVKLYSTELLLGVKYRPFKK